MSFRHLSYILSGAAVLLLAATACTQDELADGTRLPEGEYPLIINATGLSVEATPASTRATVDGDWDGVASVALSLGDETKEYNVTTTDAEKKTATLSNNLSPFWWTSRNDITVSAWWPYDPTNISQMPAVVVKADQSTQADFQSSDYISAEKQTVRFDDPTLTFSHRTARVTVILREGAGINDLTGAEVYVTGLSTDDGNPATITTYAPSDKTYEALAAPQTVKANTPFIQVDLNGGTFYFRPKNDVVLAANSRYTYTVNVTAKGLELAGCTIGDWTNGSGESGTAEDLGYFIQDDGSYTPVGNSGQTYNGTFDGQGHSITGLAITTNSTGGENAVLFGSVGSNGTVKNLQLKDVNCDVQQNGVAGGIANSNYGTITACSVTGEIKANNGAAGGIAVINFGTITACWFDGNLTTSYDNGGIAAYNYSTITTCFYGGNAGHGAYNQGGTIDATKVEGTTTWQTAVDGMNAALTDNAYQWTSGTDGLPVLKKK